MHQSVEPVTARPAPTPLVSDDAVVCLCVTSILLTLFIGSIALALHGDRDGGGVLLLLGVFGVWLAFL